MKPYSVLRDPFAWGALIILVVSYVAFGFWHTLALLVLTVALEWAAGPR